MQENNNLKKIGVIGIGMVGGAIKNYFEKQKDVKLFLYDKFKEIGSYNDVNKADYIFVCVPTPYQGGKCDLNIIEEVFSKLDAGKIIIIKSTVLPGTTNLLQKKYPMQRILFNPEFLTEQTSEQDMNYPDRQIIGFTPESYNFTKDVLALLPLAPFERIIPAYIAEFVKYAGNTWFSVKVAKNNELYDLFKAYGGEEEDFINLVSCMSADKRIGRSHLSLEHKGSRGYGGSCLPKDAKAFLSFAKSLGIEMPVLEATDKYNDALVEEQGLKPLEIK